MMEKTLQALKVPELKAKCKELKIPNFSKLSKADLIAKILGASSGTDPTHETQLPKTAEQSTLKAMEPSSRANDEGKGVKGKEGKVVKKRKATDQAGPPTSKSAAPRASANDTPQVGGLVPAEDLLPAATVFQAASSNRSSSIQPVQPAPPPEPKPMKKTTVTSSTTQTSSAPPKPTTQAKVTSKPQSTSRPPIAQKPQANPKPQIVKTPVNAAATSKTKSKAVALPIKHAVKPRFRPLVQIQPVQTIPQATRPQETIIDLSTLTSRIKFIESHFLNILFTYLHKYRAKSMTGPRFPCPPSFSKSKIYPQVSHLAFQGLHADIYNSDSDAFQVAIRFWLARMHSYMQLGSGEAWSSRAGGIGMLGPDMATWPPIMKVEKVAGEVWAISTQEEEGEIKYLVIGEIGEVVASSKGATGDAELIHGCIVRSDWARYLGVSTRKSFVSMVKSKESYDFPGGIAKAWSAKQSEGMIKIANRAVLASCALNSFSGDKLSALVMDGAHIGRPALGSVTCNDLDFYLPENSQILSVHRPASLHPALAIVHRGSGFSEFVLAETGQMVGLEDEGVVSLWQGLLGCNAKGQADDAGQVSFWKAWESRMKFGRE